MSDDAINDAVGNICFTALVCCVILGIFYLLG